MADELFIESSTAGPDAGPAIGSEKETASLMELAKHFHLFTLGPVYTGACLDSNLLQVFAEQEQFKFRAVTIEQPFQMFENLNEWDYMIQGIEKTEDDEGLTNTAARNFAQFMQGYEFVRRESRFYAKVYTRPVQIVPPRAIRGVSVEVFLLTSNKGTQEIHGANPYEITVDQLRISPLVERDADNILDMLS